MINIVTFLNPNYRRKNLYGCSNKPIDVVSQFVGFYKSIKSNWDFEYKVSIFYNKNIQFNETDKDKLHKCRDVDFYPANPDHAKLPYRCKCACFSQKLKVKGTHRLYVDTDMIALANPPFELEYDWQAMYDLYVRFSDKMIKQLCDRYNYNFDFNKKYQRKELYKSYIFGNKDYKLIFPYFNGGCLLIKEELVDRFVELYKPSHAAVLDFKGCADYGFILQHTFSLSLLNLSNYWKPFKRGINIFVRDLKQFHKNGGKASLVHYAGPQSEEAIRMFPHYLDQHYMRKNILLL